MSCHICYGEHPGVSCYWHNQGKTPADKRPGRTFESSMGNLMCAECCNGDHCDDPTHFDRQSCPYCLGSGINATVKPRPEQAVSETERLAITERERDLVLRTCDTFINSPERSRMELRQAIVDDLNRRFEVKAEGQ